MTRITAAEAQKNSSDIIDRVSDRGERFEIARDGKIIARIEPAEEKRFTVGDLFKAIREGPRLEPGDGERWEKELAELRREIGPPQIRWE